MNLNKVTISGRLARDPEQKFTTRGTAICSFSVAVNRKWKDEAGAEKEEVTFVECAMWGKTAEAYVKYHKKGRETYIEGRLKLDQWDDKATGQKRSKLTVVAESWQFVGSGEKGGAVGQPAEVAQAPRPARPAADPLNGKPEEDDEPPF